MIYGHFRPRRHLMPAEQYHRCATRPSGSGGRKRVSRWRPDVAQTPSCGPTRLAIKQRDNAASAPEVISDHFQIDIDAKHRISITHLLPWKLLT
jgi:hypothetical protein